MFDQRTPIAPIEDPPPPIGPVPSATPIVLPKPPPTAEPQPKKLRAPPPVKKSKQEIIVSPPPLGRPFAAELARVKASPTSDLRFELADQVEAAADKTLDRQAAAGVKACLTQFRITGGVRHLEQCVEKFERARGSAMTP